MELGFETIGNATLIAHDLRPVVVTDPWLVGTAYFGSWTLSHAIPEEQLEAARRCDYAWISHGHPDHLSGESLALLRDKTLLVPNHFGGRIAEDLREQGFRVEVLVDRRWKQLSPRIRVLCVPDYNQDGILLLDIGGKLVVNLNDASDRGWSGLVRKVIKRYPVSFLLALSGYGDADMINFWDEAGNRIPPYAARKTPVGQTITRLVEFYGARYFVPFSSMHKYQRADSIWASEYTTNLGDYAKGFESRHAELTPAFIRYDALSDRIDEIRPPERPVVPVDPSEFGDDWGEPLEKEDVPLLREYFRRVKTLEDKVGFLNFRVGGEDHRIELDRAQFERGITFEVPRTSLMTAVRYQIFDDLLIGNFMKTTLHGEWGPLRLYPDFTPYVAKYADNGRVRTPEELARYFHEYRGRDPLGFLRHQLEVSCLRPLQEKSAELLREKLGGGSPVFRTAKNVYWGMKRALF